MSRQKRRGYAGEHQTGQYGDRQDVFFDLLASLGLGRAKDDALDFVVYSATCLESVRVRSGCEIVQVGLEEPEGLHMLATMAHVRRMLKAHQERTINRFLA